MQGYNVEIENDHSENMLAGIVGAFLFSLAGGIVWFVLYQIGFMAGLSGLVGVICAIKGYSIFAKAESKKGIIVSIIIAMLVIVIAWYSCLALDVYHAYQEWYEEGEIDFTLTYFESFRVAYLFLTDWEIASGYVIDLLIGLALCVVGSIRYIINAFKKLNAQQNPQPQPAFGDPSSSGQWDRHDSFPGDND